MRDDYPKFQAAGAKLVVVARHKDERLEDKWADKKLPYPGVPDPDGKIGALYKQQWHALKLGLMPAQFVIDRDGRIAYAYYSKSMSDIPRNDDVLKALAKLR